MNIEKRKPFRSKAILDSAKDEACTLNAPGCLYTTDTTVFCHLNEEYAGKGLSQKAWDLFGCFACTWCHNIMDGRINPPRDWTEHKYYYLLKGMVKTQMRLIEEGTLK